MRPTLLPFFLSLGTLVLAVPAFAVPPPSDRLTTLLHDTFTAYRSWGRVDDELRWAPWLCRMPLASQARLSAADPGTPHAQKVFFVYAQDRTAYLRTSREGLAAPIGQVVVKESFSPSTLSDVGRAHLQIPSPHEVGTNAEEREFRALTRDGHRVGPGEFRGLYVLAKIGGEGTDRGWAYGTLSPDGEITAAGRVASCMGCHVDAPHDRLFGLDSDGDRIAPVTH